jgi:hypothetical protein
LTVFLSFRFARNQSLSVLPPSADTLPIYLDDEKRTVVSDPDPTLIHDHSHTIRILIVDDHLLVRTGLRM